MRTKVKQIIFSLCWLVALVALANHAFAQAEYVTPFMQNLPQASYVNPLARPSHTFSLGLPASSYSLYYTSNFNSNDVITIKNDTAIINPSPLFESDRGNIYQRWQASFDYLHFRFRVGNTFWGLNVTEKIDGHLGMNRTLLQAMWQGNGAFLGTTNPIKLTETELRTYSYREFALSSQFPLGDKLKVGVRGKVLFGQYALWVHNVEGELITDPDNAYALTANGQYRVDVSQGNAPFTIEPTGISFDLNRFANNFSNPGYGVDLGVEYEILDELKVGFLATNLGFITYNKNVRNYTGDLSSITFNGLNYVERWIAEEDADVDKFVDTLVNKFVTEESEEAFTVPLVPNYMFTATYKPIEQLDLNAGVFMQPFLRPRVGMTLNAYHRLSRLVHYGISYTIHNRSFNNFGAGLMFQPGPFQFYALADNIGMLVFAQSTNHFGMRLGLNFTFGYEAADERDRLEF